jgi:signal transduction histidine kinase
MSPLPRWLTLIGLRVALPLTLVAAALVPELMIVKRFFPYPFLFLFFGAIVASAWFGGMAAGLFAVVLSILAVDFFFIPPVNSFVFSPAAGLYLGAFVLCAMVGSWVSSSRKKSEKALKQARNELEVRVSERSDALIKTQAELAHLSRALSMGELTASIAHEIKQPLTAVISYGHASLGWLGASPPNLERAQRATGKIISEATRAGSVINRIQGLFKKEPPSKDWLDLNELIEEMMVLFRQEAVKRRISIQTNLARGLPRVKADHIQIQQVVLNLIMNAVDAVSEMPDDGRQVWVRSSRRGMNEVLVQVEDRGIGLNGETAHKIFEPFFTTKRHGIGMGLSISRSIIESHGGKLWATSRSTGGSLLEFVIPVFSEDSHD